MILFVIALVTMLIWGIETLLGDHPDGAILGFSGTMWAIWATTQKQLEYEEDRRQEKREEEKRERLEQDRLSRLEQKEKPSHE
jgi:hypothetical protein